MSSPLARARFLALLLVILATPLQAQGRRYLFELGVAGAATSFADVTDLETGFGGALRLGFWLPANLGIELEGLASSPSTTSGVSTNVLTGTASLLYNIRAGESSSLLLRLGFGSTKYGDSCPVVSIPGSGPCGTASALVFGGGFRAALSQTIMLRGEVDVQRNSDATSFSNIVGSLGLAFMVGSRPYVDTDQDGVDDHDDKCPDTPVGAIVNAKGCPSDTDGDGVADGLDRCPNTPAGASVDGAGCPMDTDKDGVLDGVDQCPDTPAGASVNATGCSVDSDADGVPDGLDRCPATPAGATVDTLGCPGDSDNDRVPDGLDQCPDTPAGVTVNSFGCPAAEALPGPPPTRVQAPPAGAAAAGAALPTLAPRIMWIVPGTTFAPQSSTIGNAGLPVLDSVVAVLKASSRTTAEITGHADEAADRAANNQLALARADAVRSYLVRNGVRPQQLQVRGVGAGIANPTGAMPQNRQTEIRITSP